MKGMYALPTPPCMEGRLLLQLAVLRLLLQMAVQRLLPQLAVLLPTLRGLGLRTWPP